MQAAAQCSANAFIYNATHCACNPGYLYNLTTTTCVLFSDRTSAVELGNGVSYDSDLGIPGTVISFNSIKNFTQSQAVFLEATLVMLFTWLGFCLLLRAFPLRSNGHSIWFKIRWWISRLDISFATLHWLQDQKPLIKRKTELGGTLSIATWILFIGMFAALFYQIISNRSVEVNNVKATNAPDLGSFLNDFEFNITTISTMSCVQLRGLGTLVMGNPVLNDHRAVPLATFANYSCLNTTLGPTISLKCNSCRLIRDFAYISWQFVDVPNNPAAAVGFQFNLTAKSHMGKNHLSFVSGTLQNASDFDDKPITFRGTLPHILKFNLFPRVYRNLNDLKLVQPLFHEFLRGSFFGEVRELQASLERSSDGLINTTLSINFLSSYIIEIDNQNIMGPVSFLADLGGLYCISIGIFFLVLVQCEYRIKRLRNEDSIMRTIRKSQKAQDHWNKLRKYVRYTWGSSSMNDYRSEPDEACCVGVMSKSFCRNWSARRRSMLQTLETVSFSKHPTLPNKKETDPGNVNAQVIKSGTNEAAMNKEKSSSLTTYKPEDVLHGNVEHSCESSLCSHLGGVCQSQGFSPADTPNLPPLPSIEYRDLNEISMADLQKNLQKLYEYNVMLREELIAASLSKDHVQAVKGPTCTAQ